MPYKVGAKGSYGCSGYPALKVGTNEVMGCHKTRAAAAGQIYAINVSEGNVSKSMPKEGDMVMAPHDDEVYIGRVVHVMTEGMLGSPDSEYSIAASQNEPALLIQLFELEEGEIEETEYFVGAKASEVMAMPSLEENIGMDKVLDQIKDLASVVKQLVGEIPGGTPQEQIAEDQNGYKNCGCETCKAMNVDCPDCPACSPKNVGEGQDQEFEATKPDSMDEYDNAMGKSDCCPDEIEKQAPCWEGYVQRGMKPGEGGRMVPNCVPAEKADDLWEDDDTVIYEDESVSKAEGYSPPAGARSAARRAIKFKEDGKANGAGTAVGWTRAGQLARGESLSLSTVKRMYSYFSRHEVDKKGKDWGNTANPSNGYIMWLAWGGDAGFSWSRSIVEREKKKSDRIWANSPFNIQKG